MKTICTILLLMICANASAYSYLPYNFCTPTVDLRLRIDTFEGLASRKQEVWNGVADWNVGPQNLTINLSEIPGTQKSYLDNGSSEIIHEEMEDALGLMVGSATSIVDIKKMCLTERDIFMRANSSDNTFHEVLLHEFGHFVGLDHTPDRLSIMDYGWHGKNARGYIGADAAAGAASRIGTRQGAKPDVALLDVHHVSTKKFLEKKSLNDPGYTAPNQIYMGGDCQDAAPTSVYTKGQEVPYGTTTICLETSLDIYGVMHPIDATIYLSEDATIDTTDTKLTLANTNTTTYSINPVGNPNGFPHLVKTVRIPVLIPKTLLKGAYHLGMILDPDQKIIETNEWNNTSGLPFQYTYPNEPHTSILYHFPNQMKVGLAAQATTNAPTSEQSIWLPPGLATVPINALLQGTKYAVDEMINGWEWGGMGDFQYGWKLYGQPTFTPGFQMQWVITHKGQSATYTGPQITHPLSDGDMVTFTYTSAWSGNTVSTTSSFPVKRMPPTVTDLNITSVIPYNENGAVYFDKFNSYLVNVRNDGPTAWTGRFSVGTTRNGYAAHHASLINCLFTQSPATCAMWYADPLNAWDSIYWGSNACEIKTPIAPGTFGSCVITVVTEPGEWFFVTRNITEGHPLYNSMSIPVYDSNPNNNVLTYTHTMDLAPAKIALASPNSGPMDLSLGIDYFGNTSYTTGKAWTTLTGAVASTPDGYFELLQSHHTLTSADLEDMMVNTSWSTPSIVGAYPIFQADVTPASHLTTLHFPDIPHSDLLIAIVDYKKGWTESNELNNIVVIDLTKPGESVFDPSFEPGCEPLETDAPRVQKAVVLTPDVKDELYRIIEMHEDDPRRGGAILERFLRSALEQLPDMQEFTRADERFYFE